MAAPEARKAFNRRAAIIATGAFVIAIGVGSPRGYKYRLTFEFRVHGQPVKASIVRKIVSSDVSAFPNGRLLHSTTSGDALAVELMPGRVLFVLLKDSHGADWAPDLGSTQKIGTPYGVLGAGGLTQVRLEDLPLMVTFANVSDANSGQLVDPKNLAATFGPGVQLVRAGAERTSASVSRGVQNQLPWLKKEMKKSAAGATVISSPGQFTPNVSWFIQ